MKRYLLGTATAAVIAMSTQAASSADVSVPTLFSYWIGPYVGVQGGWGWTTTRGLPNATGDFGGGLIGYNYQINNIVLGLEGEGSFANISGRATDIFGIRTAVGYRDDGLASLRGRFGLAFDNFLFYGTAGGGWGHGNISTSEAFDALAAGKAWHTGWTAGGGIEYGFLPTWTIKLEYLHYGLGSELYFGRLNTGNIDIDTFRVGVNYIFR